MSKWESLFGNTNDPDLLRDAHAFRDAAVEDGWDIRPTYNSEPEVRAASLSREGFKMQVISRSLKDMKFAYSASVHIWGPDGLAVTVPDVYDWAAISGAVDKCLECGAEGEVHRAGFAGRYCAKCLPEQKKAQEFPGWTS